MIRALSFVTYYNRCSTQQQNLQWTVPLVFQNRIFKISMGVTFTAGTSRHSFFNHFNTNFRVSYTSVAHRREALGGGAMKERYNKLWLQLFLC
jgi:hypothetical protein